VFQKSKKAKSVKSKINIAGDGAAKVEDKEKGETV